ncbi:MAG: MptD family putative ECF transporter S component [Actinomycetota bacterium]
MSPRLSTRDLITIGIFSAVYLVGYVILSSVLFTPWLFILLLPVGALLMGPVYLLFVARTQTPFAITTMGLLAALIAGLLVYGNVLIAVVNLGVAVIADAIAFAGRYRNLTLNVVSYVVMSFWVVGQVGPMWVARDWWRDLTVNSGYSADFADGSLDLATPLTLTILVAATIAAALVSSFAARNMLDRHFRRAGLVE